MIDVKIELTDYVRRNGLPFLQYFNMDDWVELSIPEND